MARAGRSPMARGNSQVVPSAMDALAATRAFGVFQHSSGAPYSDGAQTIAIAHKDASSVGSPSAPIRTPPSLALSLLNQSARRDFVGGSRLSAETHWPSDSPKISSWIDRSFYGQTVTARERWATGFTEVSITIDFNPSRTGHDPPRKLCVRSALDSASGHPPELGNFLRRRGRRPIIFAGAARSITR